MLLNRCCVCGPRAFLKHSAEVVYHLDGKNVSVVLQGEASPLTFISLSLVKSLRCLASLVVAHFLFLGIFFGLRKH